MRRVAGRGCWVRDAWGPRRVATCRAPPALQRDPGRRRVLAGSSPVDTLPIGRAPHASLTDPRRAARPATQVRRRRGDGGARPRSTPVQPARRSRGPGDRPWNAVTASVANSPGRRSQRPKRQRRPPAYAPMPADPPWSATRRPTPTGGRRLVRAGDGRARVPFAAGRSRRWKPGGVAPEEGAGGAPWPRVDRSGVSA